MDQSLEWLQLVGDAIIKQRRLDLLDAACASRAGQATQDGYRQFTRELRENI